MNDVHPHPLVEEILIFWFGDDPGEPWANQDRWFTRSDAFDGEIRNRFSAPLEKVENGSYGGWGGHPRPALAFILLTDQFPRNIHRDSAQAFAYDGLALRCSLSGQAQGLDTALSPVERCFFYLPMMHSEDPAIQRRAAAAYRTLAEMAPDDTREALENVHRYALAHERIIERFGRFPHRNDSLGRESTPAEIEFLKEPDSSFGGERKEEEIS